MIDSNSLFLFINHVAYFS